MTARTPALVALALALIVARPAAAKHLDKDFRHTFPAAPGTVLHLVHGDGVVKLLSWGKDSIAVHVRYRGDVKKFGWGKDPDFEVEFSQSGGTINVIGRQTGGGTAGLLTVSHEGYFVDVQAPPYVSLDFEGADGDVTVNGWRADVAIRLEDGVLSLRDVTTGQVRVAMEGGRVTLDGIHADLFLKGEDGKVDLENLEVRKGNIRMADGDVTIKGARGNFDIEMEDGDLHLTRGRLENASVHTEGGDVDLDLEPSPQADLDVFTRSGSVRIGLAPQSSVRYSIETKTGRLRVSLPGATGVHESKNRLSGDWNGGESRLRVITIDGPVDVRPTPR